MCGDDSGNRATAGDAGIAAEPERMAAEIDAAQQDFAVFGIAYARYAGLRALEVTARQRM